MKPKLSELLGENPTKVELKFLKKISTGASMYECTMPDGKECVHFDEDSSLSGEFLAMKNGRKVFFVSASAPLFNSAPAPAPATVSAPSPSSAAQIASLLPPKQTPPPAPAPAPTVTVTISLEKVADVADALIERLGKHKQLLGDNFASTVNTLLIRCLQNVNIEVSVEKKTDEPVLPPDDLPF